MTIGRSRLPAVSRFHVAAAGLVLAGITLLVTLGRAMRTDDPGTAPPATITLPHIALGGEGSALHAGTRLGDDPFSPERSAPPNPYRLTSIEPAPPLDRTPASVPVFPTVLGTVRGSDGTSFVTCSLGDGPAKNVRVGGAIGPFVVETIERGRVVFVTASGQRFDVRTPPGGS